ncbi:multiprotein-bridging factor 1 family protein [Streptomonospora nanhaiensis]|uniref:helix-turn-helix domain-containing protein n=1 Tax=Streptomonospora nanhaiensis TaxID=1323731 RepID=UPI001C9985D8|nr:DNA-binding protein [Streptomonospora nanhaiensis]MBX9387316.1 DNA-binding protein [Streptomonospora nanhaiensis]
MAPSSWPHRIQRARRDRGWGVQRLARELRKAAGPESATTDSLMRSIRNWENGLYVPSERNRLLLHRVLDIGVEDTAPTPPLPLDASRRSGEGAEEELRRTTADLIRLDGMHGGGAVVDLAVRAANRARDTAASSDERGLRGRLSAVSEAEQVAGWAAYDADRQDLCAHLTSRALQTAALAGDSSAELMALSQMAMWAVQTGEASCARQTSEHALARELPPRVRVLFEVRLARALGLHGERIRALAMIRQARARFDDGPSRHDPAWAWWLDEGELTWHHGMIHASMGEWGQAGELFAAACAHRRPGRGRYNDAVHLSAALVRTRQWAEAERVVVQDVAQTAPLITSLRIRHLLARITAVVPAEPRTDTLGQALRAALRS